MGKRRIKKHKIKSNVNKDENTSSDKLNEEDDDNQIKLDLTSMLDIINTNNSFELLKLSSFLSNYNYEILSREQDKKEKEIFVLTSSNFLLPYLNKLLSQNTNAQNEQKIKYNIISSIINIISFFSDKIDLKLIYKKILSEIFNQYLVNYIKEKNNNILNQINNKIILLVFDLFQLFIDIMKEEEKINTKSNLINYDKIIDVLIKEYLFNENIDRDIKNKSELLLFSLFSNFYIEMNDKNNAKLLLNTILESTGELNISSFIYFISFYISVNNNDLNSLNIVIQKIIDFSKDIIVFNSELNDFTQFLNEVFDLDKENINNIKENISDDETKQKLNSFLFNCHTIYSLFKILNDIIENLGEDFSTDDIFLTNISTIINKLFNKSNNILINQCFNDNFISSLLKLLNNLTKNNIESFFMDNNDCILRIKENLNEMSVLILGIINNIVSKLNKKLKKDNIGLLMNIIYIKLNKYKSDNDEEIYLIILLLRNILEKKIINIEDIISENNKNEELNPLDYKLLFSIFNYYMNDDYIKINIIDIIALIYSTEITNDKSWYEIIQEINNLLVTLLYNEKNIEIASHVINAFMDIYQWDDEILNKILKNSNILNIMSNGSKNFKQKMENLYKTNELTEDAYSYISETLTNMKRFIKYKKDI
jgi:hypothetical protein